MRDYYEILGLKRGASAADIKKAYKKLARKFHPDVNPGDKAAEAKFKEISEAYAVLSNAERRKEYDRFGFAGAGGYRPPEDLGVQFEGFDFGESFRDLGGAGRLEDLFRQMFGGGFRSGGDARRVDGEDIAVAARVAFDEVLRGAEREIAVERMVSCEKCGGEGRQKSAGMGGVCPACGGSGRRDARQGRMVFSSTCPACGGSGRAEGPPCPSCGGAGRVRKMERLRVRIPAGVESGSRVRVPGKGHEGLRGGQTGDLHVVVSADEHPRFRRVGHNIEIEASVSVAEAALGAKIEVPTPWGPTLMKIIPGTQPGQVYRLREKGLPVLGGAARGDLLVTVKVVVPKAQDERTKEILRELEKLNPVRRG